MTEVFGAQRDSHTTQPVSITENKQPIRNRVDLPSTKVNIPSASVSSRAGHLNLDVLSPVNQNGSFEFDRVLRSGEVSIRSRKTKVCNSGAEIDR